MTSMISDPDRQNRVLRNRLQVNNESAAVLRLFLQHISRRSNKFGSFSARHGG